MNYTSLFYWKVEDEQLDKKENERILSDIIKRGSMETIYVGLAHIKGGCCDPHTLETVSDLCSIFHKNKRKMILDVDVRHIYRHYKADFKKQTAGFVKIKEVSLNEEGCGTIDISDLKFAEVIDCVVFDKLNGVVFENAVRQEYKAENNKNTITVKLGRENAGKTAAVSVMFEDTVDIFDSEIFNMYTKMLETYKDVPIDGIGIDEWGENHGEWENGCYFNESFYYSKEMNNAYKKLTGRELREDLYKLIYKERDKNDNIGIINTYLELYRNKMAEVDNWYYDAGKRYFGKECFIAAHATLWGDDLCMIFDALHNGLDWWKVKRDYSQTDEWVIMPIRTALAHKCGGNVWYNMWYVNTLSSFCREAWINARYGGRMHYLGYGNRHEKGLFPAVRPGNMEALTEMDKRVGELNEFQQSPPDCRVLIVFGIESALNWRIPKNRFGLPNAKRIVRNEGADTNILKFAKYFFEKGYMCDLVPTYEIESGDLHIEKGKAHYGNQTYDAVILLSPNGIKKNCIKFFEDYIHENKNLIIAGECNMYSDGDTEVSGFDDLCEKVQYHIIDDENFDLCFQIVKEWGVPKNKYDNGCVYQDGSVIFTTGGYLPCGNPIAIDEYINGHHVEYKGMDYLGIKLSDDGKIERIKTNGEKLLKIDGKDMKNGLENQ